MENKYILQESENKGFWVCTDTINKIVVVFENGKFNETQKMTALDDFNPKNFMQISKYMREIGVYLFNNHYEKCF